MPLLGLSLIPYIGAKYDVRVPPPVTPPLDPDAPIEGEAATDDRAGPPRPLRPRRQRQVEGS